MRPIKECVKWFVSGVVLLILVSGCGPGAAALEATVVAQVEENIVQTVAAQPTVTHQPTYTAEPTYTIQPTHTTQPTLTSRPTLTPEATYTPRPAWPLVRAAPRLFPAA